MIQVVTAKEVMSNDIIQIAPAARYCKVISWEWLREEKSLRFRLQNSDEEEFTTEVAIEADLRLIHRPLLVCSLCSKGVHCWEGPSLCLCCGEPR